MSVVPTTIGKAVHGSDGVGEVFENEKRHPSGSQTLATSALPLRR